MKIKVLPDTPIEKEMIAMADRGFKCLYDGITFDHWKVSGGWKPNDWRINHNSDGEGEMVSRKEYGDASFIVDFRSGNESFEFNFRGQSFQPSSWAGRLLAKGNGWNRMQADFVDGKLSITINEKSVGEPVRVEKKSGPVTISVNGKCELANIYIRE